MPHPALDQQRQFIGLTSVLSDIAPAKNRLTAFAEQGQSSAALEDPDDRRLDGNGQPADRRSRTRLAESELPSDLCPEN